MTEQKNGIINLKSAENLRQTMDAYFLRLKDAVDTKRKKIAWCSSVGPVELLYSMGFEVYFPENHGAMLGVGKMADKYISTAISHGYSPDVCSYLTSDIGAFLQNTTPLQHFGFKSVPAPDILVFNTNQCHEVGDWFNFYAKHFKVPILGIRTPLCINELSASIIDGVAEQLKSLVPEIEKVAKQKFDIDKFRETIDLSCRVNFLWRRILQSAQNKPSPINFFDATIHMGPIVTMRGTQYAVDYYLILLKELNERIKNRITAIPEERYRVYWDGMPLWFKLSSMAKLFAQHQANIVASTYCNSWIFDDLNPIEPFESSALASCKLFIARSDEAKEKVLQKQLVDFSVDGIIFHESKTCTRNSNNRFGLQNRLFDKTKIPFLEINGDLNDPRCFSEEQSVIAIETFINQLSNKQTINKPTSK